MLQLALPSSRTLVRQMQSSSRAFFFLTDKLQESYQLLTSHYTLGPKKWLASSLPEKDRVVPIVPHLDLNTPLPL